MTIALFLCTIHLQAQLILTDFHKSTGEVRAIDIWDSRYLDTDIIQFTEYGGLEILYSVITNSVSDHSVSFGHLGMDDVLDLSKQVDGSVCGIGITTLDGCESLDPSILRIRVNAKTEVNIDDLLFDPTIFFDFVDDHQRFSNKSFILNSGEFIHLINGKLFSSNSDSIIRVAPALEEIMRLEVNDGKIFCQLDSGIFELDQSSWTTIPVIDDTVKWMTNISDDWAYFSDGFQVMQINFVDFDIDTIHVDTFNAEYAICVRNQIEKYNSLHLWSDGAYHRIDNDLVEDELEFEFMRTYTLPQHYNLLDAAIGYGGAFLVGSLNDNSLYRLEPVAGDLEAFPLDLESGIYRVEFERIDRDSLGCQLVYESKLFVFIQVPNAGGTRKVKMLTDRLEFLCHDDCNPGWWTQTSNRFGSGDIVEAQFIDTIVTNREITFDDTLKFQLSFEGENTRRLGLYVERYHGKEIADIITETTPSGWTDLNIYPNPTTGKLYIEDHAAQQISLFDQHGNLIMKCVETSDVRQMDISELPSGLYFLQSTYGDNVSVKMIVKK